MKRSTLRSLARSRRPKAGPLAAPDIEQPVSQLRLVPGPIAVLPDGAQVHLEGDGMALRDTEGRILVRYENGAAEIAAPSGNLTLSAPQGRVVLRAGQDISLSAEREIAHRAGAKLTLSAGDPDAPPAVRIDPSSTEIETHRLDVKAVTSRVTIEEGAVLARRLATTAETLVQNVERFELTATRLIERAGDAFRDVAGLSQTRVGRARTIVKDLFSVHARRTALTSDEETSIDGKKVLLG